MASYNSEEFKNMQREAVNRVNEMHRRSRQMVMGQNGFSQSRSEPPQEKRSEPAPPLKPENKPAFHRSDNNFQGLISSLFSGGQGGLNKLLSEFKIDEEKALIAMIIYILAKNGADVKLLIGLGYLLL